MIRQKITALILAAALLFSGCATDPKNKNTSVLSSQTAQEIAIGEQIHATILSSFYPYTDPKVVTYVNKIGKALAEHSERRELPYRFTILYSDKIYATSAPGGFVYLTTGMMTFVENEAELAAVLAHEIAELQYRDPNLSNSRKLLENVTRGGAMIGPAFGPIGLLAAVGLIAVNAAAQPHALSLDKRLARADQRALHYMMAAGEDPQGMLDLFYKFLRAKGEVIPYFYDYYRSRPISEERFAALNKAFAKLPLQDQSFDTHRDIYQDATRGLREMYRQ